jgi:hypothetical protein
MNYTILSLLSIVPLFFYLVDGYFEQNIKKGILYVLGFLVLGLITILILKSFSLKFVSSIPMIILIFILINYKKN